MSRNAATAAKSYAAENQGQYTGMTIASLQATEPSLTDAGSVQTVTLTRRGGSEHVHRDHPVEVR